MKIYKWVPISTLDQVYKKIRAKNKIMLIKANNYKRVNFLLYRRKKVKQFLIRRMVYQGKE